MVTTRRWDSQCPIAIDKDFRSGWRAFRCILCILALVRVAQAQAPKHEFRGAWIATVINLDWPTSSRLSTASKKADLVAMLDGLEAAGLNTVFFQVRTECDALYDSPFDPWSVYLTGQQGRPPDPYFDPLSFAVDEAHARGLSLHAWLNPFRCEREVGRYPLAASHPAVLHPDWMLTLESGTTPGRFHTIMNPGLEEVHGYVASIVDDIVRRYDVDGIHFDDYFYPYPPYQMGAVDLATFDADPRGFGNLSDWRRDNINRFVARISETVASANPDAVFGISPFGIWRTGTPAGIVGLSGADALFADAVAWMNAGTVDYLAPQLYWPFGSSCSTCAAQDFAALTDWWVSVSNGRHIYPGLGVYRSDPATNSGAPFAPTEVPSQIRFTRASPGAEGNILFRAENITSLHSSGLSDSLATDLYRWPALPPPMPWRDLFPPDPPESLRAVAASGKVTLEWDPSIFGFVLARSFAVYRTEGAPPADLREVTASAENLLGRAYDPLFVDQPTGSGPFHYVVTGLSGNSAESAESNLVSIQSVVTGVEHSADPGGLELFPNPFTDRIWLLSGATGGQLEVFDVLGRRVGSAVIPEGTLRFVWNSPQDLPPGLYVFRVRAHDGQMSSVMALRAP
jgi:uncharacterized lipoprotein YddW (UPF0748 family)